MKKLSAFALFTSAIVFSVASSAETSPEGFNLIDDMVDVSAMSLSEKNETRDGGCQIWWECNPNP